jgi:signal transduction protein with GAF and PtsI domain
MPAKLTWEAPGPGYWWLVTEHFPYAVSHMFSSLTTTTAFNAVFPLLAAVVTEQGGLFSHAAILARELGLPAVVGYPICSKESMTAT